MNPIHLDLFLWLLLGSFEWLCQVGAGVAVGQVVGTGVLVALAAVAIVATAALVCCSGLGVWGMVMVGLILWRDRHQ